MAQPTVNLSIASLPLTLFIAGLPHWYTIYAASTHKVNGGWANENPRAFIARLNAKAAIGKRPSPLEEMILRGQSAQQNGYEWWGVWGVAVIFGHLAKIPAAEMNWYTGMYVVSRVVYNYLYVSVATRKCSYLRTLTFCVSLAPSITIFFRAARELA